ncbi:hypothetical protein CR513_56648, partial [Mucuna pruriens]
MHKTPARVSLLSLLINSEGHHNLLLKMLNHAHVAQVITLENFGGHNQQYYSKSQIWELHDSHGSTLRTNSLVVRAFDGSKREVMGEIILPICIGPTTFDITFQIHVVGAVPSSLYQKVKFIADQQLINMMEKKELMISTPLPAEYIEGEEEALETSFQALEIVGTTNAEFEEGGPKPSRAPIMAEKVLIKSGFQPGKGLGKELEGIIELVALQENLGRFGLGYIRTDKEGRLGGRAQSRRLIKLDLYRHFTNGGIICPDQIAMIEGQLPMQAEWSDNVTLVYDNANESNRQDEGEGPEEEALVELERLLEQEEPKFQSIAEDLKIRKRGRERNLGGEENVIRAKIEAGLLKEYANVFAWSYRDMPGLDSGIVEHKLPLLPIPVPVWQ